VGKTFNIKFNNFVVVTEEHLRMSLLSAVEDKMKRRLREIFEQAQVMILFITDNSNVVYFYFEFRHCCTT
jgi:hypothetical protein